MSASLASGQDSYEVGGEITGFTIDRRELSEPLGIFATIGSAMCKFIG
jgi:hypothetical protein